MLIDKDKKFNALKHGLMARHAVTSPEESRPFNKLARRLLQELQPNSAMEFIMAEQVILNYWRLRRYLKLENELFIFIGEPKYGLRPVSFIAEFTDFMRKNPSVDIINRYGITLFKQFYRSLHEYQNMKLTNNSNKQEENSNEDQVSFGKN